MSDLREDHTRCARCGLVVLVGYTGHLPVKRQGRTEHYHTHCWENERRQMNPVSAL